MHTIGDTCQKEFNSPPEQVSYVCRGGAHQWRAWRLDDPSGRLLALTTISFDHDEQIHRIEITADRSYIDAVTLTLPTAGSD